MNKYVIENGILKEYGISTNYDCNDLSPVIPNGVVRIGGTLEDSDSHLRKCNRFFYEPFSYSPIKTITIPEGTEIIGEFAMTNCHLEKMWLPKSVAIFEYAATQDTEIDEIVYNGTLLDLEKIKLKPCNGNFHKIVCTDYTLNLDDEFYVDEIEFNGTQNECKETYETRWVYRKATRVNCTDGVIENS